MASLDEITDRIRRAAAAGAGVGRSIKLDLKGEGFIHIDGASVTNDDAAADLVVTISSKDLEALGRRELDPMQAVMTGRMRLSDLGLAMQLAPGLQDLFSRAV
jgi:putative sterol carrier protein